MFDEHINGSQTFYETCAQLWLFIYSYRYVHTHIFITVTKLIPKIFLQESDKIIVKCRRRHFIYVFYISFLLLNEFLKF